MKRILFALCVIVAPALLAGCESTKPVCLGSFGWNCAKPQESVAAPSPRPQEQVVQRQLPPSAPALSPVQAGLVEVAPGKYCPRNVVENIRVKNWDRAGAHPYDNTRPNATEKAVNGFDGAPAQVKQIWLAQIKAGVSKPYTFTQGDVACEMWYTGEEKGKPKDYDWKNIRVGSWVNQPGAKKGATMYEASHNGFVWRLKDPEICDNWDYDVVAAEKKAELPPSPAPTPLVPRATAPIADPFNLYVQAIVKETIPTDPNGPGSIWDAEEGKRISLMRRVEKIYARESDQTYAEEFGAVSRDLGPIFLELLAKKVIKGVSEPVQAQIVYSGNGYAWGDSTIEPSKKFPGSTYWWREVPRSHAALENSWYGVVSARSASCKAYYPSSRDLRTLRNPKQGTPSELAMFARRGVPSINLWVIMSCPTLETS